MFALIAIPVPEPQEPDAEIEDEFEASFKFAFIGAGQGGSRVAETFHKMGYRKVCVLNTAQQDLNTIKLEDERKLCIGEGGAGKNPKKAAEKFSERKDDTIDFMRKNFGNEIDRVECNRPVVLRSNILHTVEIGKNAQYPRLQFSFCFYNEPLHLLKQDTQ